MNKCPPQIKLKKILPVVSNLRKNLAPRGKFVEKSCPSRQICDKNIARRVKFVDKILPAGENWSTKILHVVSNLWKKSWIYYIHIIESEQA